MNLSYIYEVIILKDQKIKNYVTTDGQSASLSCNKAPIWGLRPDFHYCQTIAGLLKWGALSDERTGLSFTMCYYITFYVSNLNFFLLIIFTFSGVPEESSLRPSGRPHPRKSLIKPQYIPYVRITWFDIHKLCILHS
jgi:hypothetical protein